MNKFPHLFDEIYFGKQVLRNRVILAPMGEDSIIKGEVIPRC